ncbi:YoaK family protein [Celerinatantimonas yamalensis]|uniref:YoaK family protein n=1 Tax=Celerinatantimonas yamalensis TaxID=559956 RepID=A0ABW9G3R0_9GAMM
MLSRLPKWVEYGAFLLALVAGYVNAIALLGFEHQAVSHLSGTATLVGSQIVNGSGQLFHLLGILLSFVFGSAISGFMLTGTSLKLGRFYDVLLVMEACFLLVAMYLLMNDNTTGHFFASAACGLQNALATTYSGAVIRTTHVTGIFTDLGIMLGSAFRGKDLDKRKMWLFVIIVLGFISGGSVGTLVYDTYRFKALAIPAAFCFLLAIVYRIYRQKLIQTEPITFEQSSSQ